MLTKCHAMWYSDVNGAITDCYNVYIESLLIMKGI